MLQLYMVDGTTHGRFRLHYMLKSFKRVTDNQEFGLIMVTSDGIFREVEMHFEQNIPFEFHTMVLNRICSLEPKMLITNLPNTRKIIILHDVKYTEVINGYGYPETFLFEEEEWKWKEPITYHVLLVEARELHKPLELEFSHRLLYGLRSGIPYIHLRSDQYVDIKDIRFWHMSF